MGFGGDDGPNISWTCIYRIFIYIDDEEKKKVHFGGRGHIVLDGFRWRERQQKRRVLFISREKPN